MTKDCFPFIWLAKKDRKWIISFAHFTYRIVIVKLMLKSFGVMKMNKDWKGRNAVFAAAENNNLEILKLLKMNGLYAEADN